MIVFPNSKINLGLSITEKRADGYHNIETIFYPIPLTDALEIQTNRTNSKRCDLHVYGTKIADSSEENLVVKAYLLFSRYFDLPPVEIHLYKHIPSGAGLGGGSSDAAAMLKLLNDYFHLKQTESQLEAYASTLGADCAFFIKNKPTFAEGIGNVFSPVELSLKGYRILIIKPNVSVSTKEAFSTIRPQRPMYSIKDVVQRPIEEWRELLVNDFETSVFIQYPIIKEMKNELYRQGAVYASMSGSGSALFGLFAPDTDVPDINQWTDAFHYTGEL